MEAMEEKWKKDGENRRASAPWRPPVRGVQVEHSSNKPGPVGNSKKLHSRGKRRQGENRVPGEKKMCRIGSKIFKKTTESAEKKIFAQLPPYVLHLCENSPTLVKVVESG